MQTNSRGFTLIELLLVISIISLLSSIIMSQFNIARARTIDTAKKADLVSLRTALRAYHLDKGRMPNNYTCTGSCVVNNNRTTLAIEDTNSPDNPVTESGKAYRASMQELVTGGYLPKVPRSPGGAGYAYYDYGPSSVAGALIGTNLVTQAPTSHGSPESCRPFTVAYSDTEDKVSGIAAPFGAVFGIDDRFDWETCLYEREGMLYEGACPGEGGYTGETPVAPNICSTTVSSDYCLCSRY